jgi:hypothetical protein
LKAAEWTGASAICYALQTITNQTSPFGLKMMVCPEIVFQDIKQAVKIHGAISVLIPLQLGLEQTITNPAYIFQLHQIFKFNENTGVVSGRNQNNAIYLIGSLPNHFLYMDPHKIQP